MVNSMTNLFLFILDAVLAGIGAMIYLAVFVPEMAKQKAYKKLKAKEREELDRKLDVEEYFGVKSVDNFPVNISVKSKKTV